MIKGSLPEDILESVLDAFPVEFTVIDGDDRILAWNRHESRIFGRRESVLGKDVRACHRAQSLPTIESILTELKSGARDKVEFWIDRNPGDNTEEAKTWVIYWALRDKDGKYMGCMETTQIVRKDQG